MTPAPEIPFKSVFVRAFKPRSHTHDKHEIDPVVGAYYPAWTVYKGLKPSDLRLSLLTHVYYAFARVQDDGTVHSRDPAADFGLDIHGAKGCLAAFVKLREERGLHFKILLSVGGASGSRPFASIAADEFKTKRFCETARAMIDQHGLDGVDIDWEHPSNPSQGQSFVRLMSALRTHLPAPKYQLTAALPAAEWCLANIDLACLLNTPRHSPNSHPTIDHLNIMAYDFAGPWTNGQSGNHAQLFTPPNPHNGYAKRSIAAATEYLTKQRGCDPKRLVMGIPTYGRSFLGVDGPGQQFTACGGDKDGTFPYYALPTAGSMEVIDRKLGAASCKGEDGSWVSYDCPETVEMKAKFVKENGLGGVFFWTAANDAKEEERSLIVAASRTLTGHM